MKPGENTKDASIVTPEERKAVIEECARDIDEWAQIRENALASPTFKPGWLNRKMRARITAEIFAYRNAAASVRDLVTETSN